MKQKDIYMAEMVKLVCWYTSFPIHSALSTLTHLLILFARLPDLQNQPNTNAQNIQYCSTSKVYNFTKHLDTSMWVVNIFNALGIIN